MVIATRILGSFAIVFGLYAGVWALVYTIGARMQGFRLWSLRRGRAFLARKAECIGGPMDGAMLPVTRHAILGISLGEWPDVLYDAATKHYQIGTRNIGGGFDPHRCWAGYYVLRFLSDRYEWHGTAMEHWADKLVSIGGAA